MLRGDHIVKRRALLIGGAIILAAPWVADAQSGRKVWRVGILCANFCESTTASITRPMERFVEALQQAGYVDGQNIRVDYRGAGVADNRLDSVASRLVHERIDVIVAAGTSAAVAAARRATQSIPIVMAVSDDAEHTGLVGGLAQPGANVTGLSVPLGELARKQIQLLTEAVPSMSSVTIVRNPNNPGHARATAAAHEAARSKQLRIHVVDVESPVGFDQAFVQIREGSPGALLILPDPLLERGEITLFALRARLPSMFTFRGPVVSASGLMAYGPNLQQLYRRAAMYVDKILKGAKPADLPVEQPTTFDLVVNLQTARAVGLAIPTALLVRADEVVQ
jgi:putative ABC transport system substrate-binding protein